MSLKDQIVGMAIIKLSQEINMVKTISDDSKKIIMSVLIKIMDKSEIIDGRFLISSSMLEKMFEKEINSKRWIFQDAYAAREIETYFENKYVEKLKFWETIDKIYVQSLLREAKDVVDNIEFTCLDHNPNSEYITKTFGLLMVD